MKINGYIHYLIPLIIYHRLYYYIVNKNIIKIE